VLERPDDIFELIMVRDKNRFQREGIRQHQSHPKHEEVSASIPSNVRILRAEGCKLRTFPKFPPTIQECYLNSNHFLDLPDLGAFANLIVLELADNSIASIHRPLPPTLVRLNLDCNALRSFSAAVVPRSCVNISTYCNPLDPYSRVARRNPFGPGGAADEEEERPKNVYENQHNIHDSGVQKSTKANILYLVNYKPDVPFNENLWKDIDNAYGANKSWMRNMVSFFGQNAANDTPGTILQSYAVNPYIMHGVTFVNLVDRIWLRIQDMTDKDKKDELLRRFREEVTEGNGHCTNGMMVRLVNVFLGFDDNVVVKLNANQILSARIPATQERFRKSMNLTEGAETVEFWQACYKETLKDLEELEVGDSDACHWLLPLAEPILDHIFVTEKWDTLPSALRPQLFRLPPPPEPKEGEPKGPPQPKSVEEYLQDYGLKSYGWERDYIGQKWRDLRS
jgi:hypothetical protein